MEKGGGDDVYFRRCDQMKNNAITDCVRVQFMLEQIQKLGCHLKAPHKFITCKKLDETKAGGFQTGGGKGEAADPRIYISQDTVSLGLGQKGFGQKELNQTLTHELVHAYDQCRNQVNWGDLVHHACTEIRASSLSGECDWDSEVNRGNVVGAMRGGQHMECVRRRAELSVAMNPYCENQQKAKAAVQKAFENCYHDTSPFLRAP